MQLLESESSMFSHIGYDPEQLTLAVRYRSDGKLFRHEGVPVAVWEAMQGTESVGKFFHAQVKRVYPGVEVKEPPEREMPPVEEP